MIMGYYVARGEAAVYEAVASMKALRQYLICPITLATDNIKLAQTLGLPSGVYARSLYQTFPDCDPGGRMAKIGAFELIPSVVTHVLYLDADTRPIAPLAQLYSICQSGFDMVITPSSNQDDELMWHIDADERHATLLALGNPSPLQLQGGVFIIARNKRTERFCKVWRAEWEKWRGPDQAALLRALQRVPLSTWLLGRDYNGGAVIQHRWGMLRHGKSYTSKA